MQAICICEKHAEGQAILNCSYFTSTCLTIITLLFSTQGRKLGYHFIIISSNFKAESEAWSQSIVLYMDWFSNTLINLLSIFLCVKFSSCEQLDLKAGSCSVLDYRYNISMIFFFSAAFKVNLAYHCKIHFHLHTHRQTHTHFFLYFLFPCTPLCTPLPIPLTFFWCFLLRKSSKTERFSTIWISMKFYLLIPITQNL